MEVAHLSLLFQTLYATQFQTDKNSFYSGSAGALNA